MVLYLDTSALVKRYFQESHSNEVIEKWKNAVRIATSSVAYAETLASIYRKTREADLNGPLTQRIILLFQQEWESFIRVKVHDDLNPHILMGKDNSLAPSCQSR